MHRFPHLVGTSLAAIVLSGGVQFAAIAQPKTLHSNRLNLPDNIIERETTSNQTQISQLVNFPTGTSKMINLSARTLVFSQTAELAVRIYTAEGQPQMNLFNKTTGVTELQGAPVTVESTETGVTYRHAGALPVTVTIANSGKQTITLNGVTLQNYDVVTGNVFYLPRIALSPNAVVEIKLVDVSLADAPAVTLASQQMISGGRQVPFPFELVYDPQQIIPNHAYAVQAKITEGKKLRFATTSRISVITSGNPNEVEVRVDLVEAPEAPNDAPQLTNRVWQLQQITYNNDTVLKPDSPENYTVQFMPNGDIAFRADCNLGFGKFTVNDRQLTINSLGSTLAACPPESIADEFVQGLSGAAVYFFQDGDLFIDIKFDTGTMRFSAAADAE